MIELFTARSGAPSLKVNGVAMHSPYDPEREADRFVGEALGSERPSSVIVLGECLGHVSRAVSRRLPSVHLLAAFYSPDIAAASGLQGVACWSPGPGVSFSEFLRQHLAELQIEGLRVLEWPPSARAFEAVSREANDAVRRVVQELNGSFVTTVAAGRLWLRNSIANFVHIRQFLDGPLCTDDRPVVIAAPGPSLEEALPILADMRDRVDLWALPSSCPALAQAGLAPDLVVLTDPGYYAMYHLRFAAPRCPLVMPLSAARGAWALPSRPGVFLIEQPFLMEEALLRAAAVSAPRVAPHGTVAATAIDLALAAARGPVILAGLDLCERDLRSHARPNAFDTLLHLQSTRLEPHGSLAFSRASALGSTAQGPTPGVRLTPALRTYAGWLGEGATAEPGRLYRLFPSPVRIPGAVALGRESARDLLGRRPSVPRNAALLPSSSHPAPSTRRNLASGVLSNWAAETREALAALGASRSGTPWDAARFAHAAEIAYHVAPRKLMDSRRKSRQGETASALSAAIDAFEESARFLESLSGGLRG